MTEHPMTEATPLASEQITQEDRELYLALGIFHTCEDRMILAGWADNSPEMHLIARHRIAALSASPAPSGKGVSGEVAKPKWSMEDYDAFVTFEGWLNEYRRSMDADVLHSWAADMVQSGKALLAIRDRVLDILSPAPAPLCAPGGVEELATTLDVYLAAYKDAPDEYQVTEDDDLLTFGVLRRILAALSPQGLDAKEGGKRVAFYWEAGSDIREGESLSDRDRRMYEQGRRDERAGEPEAFQ